MAVHTIWSLLILSTLLTFTFQFLRKSIKWKREKRSQKPSRVLWIGRGNGLFADARSKLWAFFRGGQLFADAYFKVGSKDSLGASCTEDANISTYYIQYTRKNVVTKIPTISVPLVLVPKNQRKWFFKERSDVLDHRATGFDAVESLYTMPCGHILDFPTHVKLIHRVLTRELPAKLCSERS
jgi:hypothetical protein